MAETWRYKGGGFIPGIPARDLTAEEAERYGYELLLASGLYEPPAEPQKIAPMAVEKPKKRKKEE